MWGYCGADWRIYMAAKKISTQFPGVRYREHKYRKQNRSFDRYFSIRYRINGKLIEEGIGWASNGWNATKASLELAALKKAHLTGEGPQTLGEKRRLEQEKRDFAAAERKRKAKEEMPFSLYFEENYLPEAKANKKYDTWRRENNLFEYWIKPAIGKMPFKDIRPLHLERIKKNMNDAGKAPRSVQYALAVVRQIFNHAIKNEMFAGSNPATKVSKPKVDNNRTRFLTQNEADLLLSKLKTKIQQVHDIALLSLHCGLRASEIFDLTRGCVNLDRESIDIMDSKGKNRTIYMTKEVKDLLNRNIHGNPSDLIFKDRNGNKIKRISNSFYKTVKELGFNDGVEDRRLRTCFHSLRHTYASWLVQNGADLYTVKELLGHSTLAMTERYSHLAKDNLKNTVKIFEASLLKRTDKTKNQEVIPLKKTEN
jgi:site-specific recombinase XerD